MPQLTWNEQDFLECLAVLPEVEEYGISHTYRVSDATLTLVLTVWRLESVVELVLSRGTDDQEITHFALVVREQVRYRDEKWGESLEFRDCIVAPRRFWAIDMGDVFDGTRYPSGLNVELIVRPHIRISFDRWVPL